MGGGTDSSGGLYPPERETLTKMWFAQDFATLKMDVGKNCFTPKIGFAKNCVTLKKYIHITF